AAFRKAVELDPKDADAYGSLGALLCDHRRDYDGAIKAFREAIRLKSNYAIAHFNLGVALRLKGDLEGAIKACREAIRLKSDNAVWHNVLAIDLENQGKVDDAIACYRKAIEIDPKCADAHSNLGNVLYCQK